MGTIMFSELALTKKVLLQHRIAMAPLTRCRATRQGYTFGPTTKVYYGQRASPGGLLIAEATCISEQGRGLLNTPGIYSEGHVEMWREVAKEVESKGGYIYLQLWHMGRCSHSSFQPAGKAPVAPSAVASKVASVYTADAQMIPMDTPHALSVDEIAAIVTDYYRAAVNARHAGLHGVEIHNANGYLLQQFLSSNVNLRTDQYGGSIENRCRLSLEVCNAVIRGWLGVSQNATEEEVRTAVIAQYESADSPIDVAIRFSPFSEFGDVKEENVVEMYTYLIKKLNHLPAKLSYLHIVEPRVMGATDVQTPLSGINEYSKVFGSIFEGNVMSAGGYSSDPESAHQTIDDGVAQLVAFGRAFIPNPRLPEMIKLKEPLTPWDRSLFYIPDDVRGYVDY
eukprot:GDKJ01060268.1.p1 GENE.GDKJ01060268.1~~GDKJ01060268.1.p1  ORF type:complete len:395 (-),score=83.55 GDKJ01060268.1:215-1399(-)